MRVCPYLIVFAVSLPLWTLGRWLRGGETLLAHNPIDQHTRQARAWLGGRIDLPRPPEDLLEIAHYKGRFYDSFPPTPSLVEVPLVLLFGTRKTPSGLAVYAFCYLALAVQYAALRRRGYSTGSAILTPLAFLFGTNVYASCTLATVWGYGQALGYALATIGVCLVLHNPRRGPLGPAAGYVLLSLAVGCRPLLVFFAPLLVVLDHRTRVQERGACEREGAQRAARPRARGLDRVGRLLAGGRGLCQARREPAQAATPGRRVEVVNAGVGDAGLREEVDLLEEQGLAIAPDVVVIEFYLNDSRLPWGFPAGLEYPGWLRRHSVVAESIYRAVALDRWMKRQGRKRFEWVRRSDNLDWKNDPDAFHQLAAMAEYDWGAAWDESSWVTIREGFQRLSALAAAHRFKVAIVAFPVSFQVYARFLDDAPQQRVRKEASEQGFAFLDLLPLLRTHADEELFFDQCHPREHANELIGAMLASFLQESAGGR